jgi:hypothetical protein
VQQQIPWHAIDDAEFFFMLEEADQTHFLYQRWIQVNRRDDVKTTLVDEILLDHVLPREGG